jgi:hypothetical protein
MPFNSNTYHANKRRKRAWEDVRQARELKAKIQAGSVYDWEIDLLPGLVRRPTCV